MEHDPSASFNQPEILIGVVGVVAVLVTSIEQKIVYGFLLFLVVFYIDKFNVFNTQKIRYLVFHWIVDDVNRNHFLKISRQDNSRQTFQGSYFQTNMSVKSVLLDEF